MEQLTYAHNRDDKIEVLPACDARSLSDQELVEEAALLREEADHLIRHIRQKQAANDSLEDLQNVMEIRYGGGFAQWVIDRMRSSMC
jgi:hypothetical protein